MIEAVNAGIEAGEFVPYFQPQIAAASREIVGFEVLARWLHPTRGVLGPAEFLSVSEELNCTHLIDRAIFDQTADFLTESARAGICVPRVSFNVSLSWISDPTILELASIVQGGGTVFCLELLESFFSEGSAKDAQTSCHIGRLRSAGIEIELDDFGLSKTSLPGVMSIQPDRLKIDRRLILPMLGDVETRQLVSVLIEAGRSLGFAITAAGVESAEHAEVLRSLGCDFLQGYAFSEPMPASDVAGFLQTWRSGTREALGNIA
ncbi:MAG: EAL domain-containing protein [Sphingomonadaceae bacterium]|nr:MAG: EAL domain-containing protein [Sphingomonadaceae bacterium]